MLFSDVQIFSQVVATNTFFICNFASEIPGRKTLWEYVSCPEEKWLTNEKAI
jgi:hypothetical protein